MICKNVKIFFGMFFLAFCVSLSFSSSVSALADHSFTIDENSATTAINLCSSNSCVGYSYIYLTNFTSSCFTSGRLAQLSVTRPSGGSNYSIPVYNDLLLTYPSALDSNFTSTIIRSNPLPSGCSFDIIFTENNPYSGGIIPSGSLSITENGTFDVSTYAEAVVDVPQTSSTPYHDDLNSIKIAIYVGSATILVIYFFYCIYRMIIKPTGGFK